MRKIITSILMTLGLLLGGLVSSAPAMAAPQQDAYLTPESVGNSFLRTTPLTGGTFNHYQGVQAAQVFRSCPTSLAYRIRYTRTHGGSGTLAAGACLTITPGGLTRITLIYS